MVMMSEEEEEAEMKLKKRRRWGEGGGWRLEVPEAGADDVRSLALTHRNHVTCLAREVEWSPAYVRLNPGSRFFVLPYLG